MLVAATTAGVIGQAPGQTPPRSRQVFRSGVDLVTVAVTVTDAEGRLKLGLARDDFLLAENGKPQTITHFTSDRVPVSLGVLLDTSDSMDGAPLDDARVALDRFLTDLLTPSDEAFVGVFNHRPEPPSPWTAPPGKLRRLIDDIRPTGGTAIYDAVASALPFFDDRSHPRAALVVISDGRDTASDRSVLDVRRLLRRSEAFVYAIAIDAESKRRASTRVDPDALRAITDVSGGYTEVVSSSERLGPATSKIADELNHQYMLAYTPTRPADGSYRSIHVRLHDSTLRARARRGYVSTPIR